MNVIAKGTELMSGRNDWPSVIAATWNSSVQGRVEGILETARMLVEARKDPEINFGQMVANELPFGTDTAERLQVIAKKELLTDPAHGRLLPPSWRTLYELTKIDDDTLMAAFANGDIHPDMSRSDVAKLRKAAKPPRGAASRKAATRRQADATISLSQWKEMAEGDRAEALARRDPAASFNWQGDKTGIEWASWSWNPVTGCLHDCPYCYARDIAERFRTAFPHGFEPAFRPDLLGAPASTKLPDSEDQRDRHVFTCSMADLFGRWVPAEWINAVLSAVRENPQWKFLFLTKFPKRMAEFDIPENAWMGTTVDLQARVRNAEVAFAKVNAGVRWLSIEPMLEPLKFERLDLFDWIVIGGASRSRQTPEFRPPFDWIVDLYRDARDAGVAVYFKTNLLGNRVLELPFDGVIERQPNEPLKTPTELQYLGMDRDKEVAA